MIAEQVLRELYLVPFEACVREAGAALVMAAYNMVNGTPMTEHAPLLRKILLKGEWGFGGVVISDWSAARSTVRHRAGQRSTWPCPARTGRGAGPGPGGPGRAGHRGNARRQGDLRILRLARRVGALTPRTGPPRGIAPTASCRRAADGRS